MRTTLAFILALWSIGTAFAADDAAPQSDGTAKTLSGMSVLGNNEAPKSLVIVPWKSSRIGDGIGIVDSLSNRPMPIDRDVFRRELEYYEIRTASGAVQPKKAAGQEVGSR